MLKKINNFLFRSSFGEKILTLKDTFFTVENENITRVIKLIKKTNYKSFDNSLIIDIGAFDGQTSKLLSKAFQGNPIFAFEANSKVYQRALKNCSDNKSITLKNIAISNKKEILDFYVTTNDVSSSLNEINNSEVNHVDYKLELNIKNKVSVEAQTLDENIVDKDVLLLKIDTQGHELQVIEGATKTLKNTAFVLIEMSNHNMYVNGCKYYEVDELMRKNNFSLADIVITYRKNGILLSEYDAIYVNNEKKYRFKI